jgi:addiction module RelB/DinJ family antitoxin
MQKANINVRIDPVIKEKAQAVFSQLGLDMTTAVNLFLNQVVMQNAIPLTLAVAPPVPPQSMFGAWKGKIWMADDFDAPLEDFKEYME